MEPKASLIGINVELTVFFFNFTLVNGLSEKSLGKVVSHIGE